VNAPFSLRISSCSSSIHACAPIFANSAQPCRSLRADEAASSMQLCANAVGDTPGRLRGWLLRLDRGNAHAVSTLRCVLQPGPAPQRPHAWRAPCCVSVSPQRSKLPETTHQRCASACGSILYCRRGSTCCQPLSTQLRLSTRVLTRTGGNSQIAPAPSDTVASGLSLEMTRTSQPVAGETRMSN